MGAVAGAADTPPASGPPTISQPDLSKSSPYRVLRVVDGDTISVLGQKSTTGISTIKVRLIGVDTPETVHPSKPVEYYGKEASTFLANLLKGRAGLPAVRGREAHEGQVRSVDRTCEAWDTPSRGSPRHGKESQCP